MHIRMNKPAIWSLGNFEKKFHKKCLMDCKNNSQTIQEVVPSLADTDVNLVIKWIKVF